MIDDLTALLNPDVACGETHPVLELRKKIDPILEQMREIDEMLAPIRELEELNNPQRIIVTC
jgi:hypothetical protein